MHALSESGIAAAVRFGAGYAADVIGVEGNPLTDLRVLQGVTFVMRGGRVFRK